MKSELGGLCVILILDVGGGYTHPPCFGKRGCNGLEAKEIEEVEGESEFGRGTLVRRGAGETMLRRVFTNYNRPDYLSCQYIKWVLVFRYWAQRPWGASGDRLQLDSELFRCTPYQAYD